MRRALILSSALVCAALLSACGAIRNRIAPDPAHATPISVELAGAPSADQVGLLAAQADGRFAQADVAARITTPTSVTAPLTDVERSRVDIAVTTEPQLMLARSRGRDGIRLRRPHPAAVRRADLAALPAHRLGACAPRAHRGH